MAKKKTPQPSAVPSFELSRTTLQVCHQALAAVPAQNGQQARVLAIALSELEAALGEVVVPAPAAPQEAAAVE